MFDVDKVPVVGSTKKFLEGEDIDYGKALVLVGIAIIIFTLWFFKIPETRVVSVILMTAPLWLPFVSFKVMFDTWMIMVGKKFTIKSGRTIYEIILPPEVYKSPEAMEFAFTQIYNKASPDNLWETYIDGKRPPNYTFELVSRGGDVRFYATMPNKNAQAVAEAIYAQYPGVEIRDVELDYTAEIPNDLTEWAMMSFHMGKKKASEIPIKTYLEFGHDKMPKEEEKVDPMTPMLEMLGGIKANQQMWIQFIYRAHREQSFKNGQLTSKDTWEGDVVKEIDKIMGRDKSKSDEEDNPEVTRITPGERDLISAMERNMGKAPFEFACRVVYLSSDPTNYDGALYSRFLRSFAATEVAKRNGIGARWRTDFNYKMISDPFRKIIPALKQQELSEYKQRVLYSKSGAMEFRIMTAEEMATIFHLPGRVAMTPTLNRVTSTRSEAPNNLPVGNLPQ